MRDIRDAGEREREKERESIDDAVFGLALLACARKQTERLRHSLNTPFKFSEASPSDNDDDDDDDEEDETPESQFAIRCGISSR
jgi:hypothetical protein